jgi:hypothetical protein
LKKFLTTAALTAAVLMSGAACSSSEDAATTTTKADAAATSSTAADNESGSEANAGSSGDPDVDALCAAAKSAAKAIAANPEQIQQIGDTYQAQVTDLATKLNEKYSVSNPPSPAVAQAMGECLQDALSSTSGTAMPNSGN